MEETEDFELLPVALRSEFTRETTEAVETLEVGYDLRDFRQTSPVVEMSVPRKTIDDSGTSFALPLIGNHLRAALIGLVDAIGEQGLEPTAQATLAALHNLVAKYREAAVENGAAPPEGDELDAVLCEVKYAYSVAPEASGLIAFAPLHGDYPFSGCGVYAYTETLTWPGTRRLPLARTPIPDHLAQQTGQMSRTLNAALGDAPGLRRWQIVEGQNALRHVIPNWPMQTLLTAGQALSWWGHPESAAALQEELQQLGIEAVFLANVLTGLCLQEGQVTIAMDELIRALGRGDEARRSGEHRARVEREIWRAVLIFDALAVVGAPIGNYKARDKKEVIDVTLSGTEAVIKIIAVVPGQVSSDGSAPPAFFSYVCGPWIAKMRGNQQVLTVFGDVMRLARIPAGKIGPAWAKSIGLNLNQRWRDWGHEARLTHAGEMNRATAQFAKDFTRRDLLLGDNLFRANPDAQDMLLSKNPQRAKEYWDLAIAILKEKDGADLIGYYQEIAPAPTAVKGWQDAWLDQPLDIRPTRIGMRNVAELSQALKRARRSQTKTKATH